MERNALAQVLPDRGRGGELRKWTPGLMDNLRFYTSKALAPLFGGDVRAANAYYRDKIQPTAEYLPGAGDLMAAGEAKDAFSAGDYLGGSLLAAGAVAGLVPGVGDVAQKGIKKGIRAYHGSPHDFDKFSMDKIGTGEGAQAFGHGLYFADNEDVARGYRDRLAPGHAVFADGAHVDSLTWLDQAPSQKEWGVINAAAEKAASKKPPNFQPWMSDAIAKKVYQGMRPNADGKTADWSYVVNSAIENMSPRGRAGLSLEDQLAIEEYAMAIRDNLPPLDVKKSGRMYEVNINANPDDFLDYDKPFEEQPEVVKRHFAHLAKTGTGPDGSDLARRIESGVFLDEARQAGIPGIKYLDAGSRSAGDGSRNYVVFDDSLIEILRKYGVLPAAIGTGAFMQMMQDDPQKAQELHNFATSVRDGA